MRLRTMASNPASLLRDFYRLRTSAGADREIGARKLATELCGAPEGTIFRIASVWREHIRLFYKDELVETRRRGDADTERLYLHALARIGMLPPGERITLGRLIATGSRRINYVEATILVELVAGSLSGAGHPGWSEAQNLLRDFCRRDNRYGPVVEAQLKACRPEAGNLLE